MMGTQLRSISLWQRWGKRGIGGIFALSLLYGGGRLYYQLTGGFVESNISYDLPYDSRWEVAPLGAADKAMVDEILSQEFYYLGKGCQSYVFKSKDDRYVIKFFKYQRMRPQFWLDYVAFIPPVAAYLQEKISAKQAKLHAAFASWKLAYEELKKETGVIYVHFNKKKEWNRQLILYDKLGRQHRLELDDLEFMVQKKGQMLCDVLLEYKQKNRLTEATVLVDHLLQLILSEYQRGYADNDHALMQNTGVFSGIPMHIDVGQFIKNSIVSCPKLYKQELFNKMWKFRLWLECEHPQLKKYLDGSLEAIIGPDFHQMQPYLTKGGVARIPFQEGEK